MRILGIVAEYDPFHNGHEAHLAAAKAAVSPDLTYVVLSPCLKQQGTFALLSPASRAACAVRAGADAVFALPVAWTVRDAEHYALGAVSLLAKLGITHLAFGAEDPDLASLSRLADLLEDQPDAFRSALRDHLGQGLSWPAALTGAALKVLPEDAPALKQPNNLLAVSYLRAIRRLNRNIIPVPVPRTTSHHAAVIDPASPSASAIREALSKGNYRPACAAVPLYTEQALRSLYLSGHAPDATVADALLLHRLRTMDKEEIRRLPGLSEGLEDGLVKAAAESASARDLIDQLTSRRYPSARIRRLCAHALLGLTEQQVAGAPLPSSAHLLALRRNPAMTARWKDLDLEILSTADQWKTALDYGADHTAYRLWAQIHHLPDTLPFTEKVSSLEEP